MTQNRNILAELEAMIAERARYGNPESSYTAQLLAAGPERCAQKFGEEAVEAVVACASENRAGLVAECADSLYHMMVMLKSRGIGLDEVAAELERRTAQSGLEEKEARS